MTNHDVCVKALSDKATVSGSGRPKLNPEDEKIAAIIGESAISGICSQMRTEMLTAAASEGKPII